MQLDEIELINTSVRKVGIWHALVLDARPPIDEIVTMPAIINWRIRYHVGAGRRRSTMNQLDQMTRQNKLDGIYAADLRGEGSQPIWVALRSMAAHSRFTVQHRLQCCLAGARLHPGPPGTLPPKTAPNLGRLGLELRSRLRLKFAVLTVTVQFLVPFRRCTQNRSTGPSTREQ